MTKYEGAKVLNYKPNPQLIDYYCEMERLKKLPPEVLRKVIKEIRGE